MNYGMTILSIDILQYSIIYIFLNVQRAPIILDNHLFDMDERFTLATIAVET